jgi:hypothetical protein
LALVVCGVSLYLALKGWPERPRPAIVVWAIAGVVVFYVPIGLAASAAGVEYGLVGVAAGVIPLSAVALLVATMRSRTAESDGRLRDDSGDPDQDPVPVWAWTIRPRSATLPITPTASTSPTSPRAAVGNTQPPISPARGGAAAVDRPSPVRRGEFRTAAGPRTYAPVACSSSQEVKG